MKIGKEELGKNIENIFLRAATNNVASPVLSSLDKVEKLHASLSTERQK